MDLFRKSNVPKLQFRICRLWRITYRSGEKRSLLFSLFFFLNWRVQEKACNFNFPQMCLSCGPWSLLPFRGSYNRASIWAQPVQYANSISKERLFSPRFFLLLIVCYSFVRQAERMLFFDQHYLVILFASWKNNQLRSIFWYCVLSRS